MKYNGIHSFFRETILFLWLDTSQCKLQPFFTRKLLEVGIFDCYYIEGPQSNRLFMDIIFYIRE